MGKKRMKNKDAYFSERTVDRKTHLSKCRYRLLKVEWQLIVLALAIYSIFESVKLQFIGLLRNHSFLSLFSTSFD